MWIQEYREREKLELYQFQQRVNSLIKQIDYPVVVNVSAQLIHMLECDKNAVTHPKIANAIALLCGATSEQYDMIVADVHKGKWHPSYADKALAKRINKKYKKEQKADPNYVPFQENKSKIRAAVGCREVVKIDMYGNTIVHYASIKEASIKCDIAERSIQKRCVGKVKKEFGNCQNNERDVFVKYTFRYADEWDKMTREQKLESVSSDKKGKESKQDAI